MRAEPSDAPKPIDPGVKDSGSPHESVSDKIDAVLEYYRKEENKLTWSQQIIERVARFVGTPLFFGCVLVAVAAWILANLWARRLGLQIWDEPPFFWMQGAISFCGLLVTTVVLISQNRLGRLEEQRAHLDLQVNLLNEHKSSKIIGLLEELRRDLPAVRDRHDVDAETLQKPTDPNAVLATLDERRDSKEQPT